MTTRTILCSLDPAKYGWTACGGVTSILEPHEVRFSFVCINLIIFSLSTVPHYSSLSQSLISVVISYYHINIKPQAARRNDARDRFLKQQKEVEAAKRAADRLSSQVTHSAPKSDRRPKKPTSEPVRTDVKKQHTKRITTTMAAPSLLSTPPILGRYVSADDE